MFADGATRVRANVSRAHVLIVELPNTPTVVSIVECSFRFAYRQQFAALFSLAYIHIFLRRRRRLWVAQNGRRRRRRGTTATPHRRARL